MPTIHAAGYAVPIAPSVETPPTAGDVYQRIPATPEAFGAGLGQALSQFGVQAERASGNLDNIAKQYDDVTAREGRNRAESQIQKLLYGDPDRVEDTGYFGLQGRASLDARKDTLTQINKLYDQERRNLPNQGAVKLFDEATAASRRHYEGSILAHSSKEFQTYRAKEADAETKLRTNDTAAAANTGDLETFNRNLNEAKAAAEQAMRIRGASDAEIAEKKAEVTSTAVTFWVNGRAITNPKGALADLEAHEKEFTDSTRYAALHSHIKGLADKEAARTLVKDTATAPGGHLNYGATGALGDPRSPGWEAANLITVTSPSGAGFKVNKQAAQDFTNFLKDLEATGYQIRPGVSGGHNLRNITGGTTLSEHAYGTAIDINSDVNLYTKDGRKVTDLPPSVAALAEKHNLEWGGNWTDPVDTMHFQWRGPRAAADNNLGGIRRPGEPRTRAEGGFESYPSPEAGVQAIRNNLQRYAAGGVVTANNPEGKPLNTIRDIVSVWSPANENDTAALIARAAQTTGYKPDEVLDLSKPEVMGKMVEAIIRNEQGGRLPVSREVIAGAAAQGIPDSPLAAQVARINASNKSPEVKEAAIAELHRQHGAQALGQDQAKYELGRAVERGDETITPPYIDSLVKSGRISPEAGTAALNDLAKVQAQRAAEREALAKVNAAGAGGPPLDPKNADDRKALNYHYEVTSSLWPRQEALDRSVKYATDYGLVPDKLKAVIRGGLHSGRPDQAALAANTVARLRNANPALVGELGDENDLRLANQINSYTSAGVSAERAVELATEGMKVTETEKKARTLDFDAQRGKTTKEQTDSDSRWIERQQNSLWVRDPNVDPLMRQEFVEVAKTEFERTGNLEAARRTALDQINRVWDRSEVGGDRRYMKFAPEKFYPAPGLSPGENSAWMKEQLLGDVAKGALEDPSNPITADRLRLLPDPTRSAGGLPVYQVWLVRPDAAWQHVVAADGKPVLWKPDWNASAERQRRVAAQQAEVESARQLRREQGERELLVPR